MYMENPYELIIFFSVPNLIISSLIQVIFEPNILFSNQCARLFKATIALPKRARAHVLSVVLLVVSSKAESMQALHSDHFVKNRPKIITNFRTKITSENIDPTT